jgi:hypothetical protein
VDDRRFNEHKTKGVLERYRKTMLSLLDEVWDEEELLAEVDRLETLISSHLHESQRNTNREIDKLRSFIRSRRKELLADLGKRTGINVARVQIKTIDLEKGSATLTIWRASPDATNKDDN